MIPIAVLSTDVGKGPIRLAKGDTVFVVGYCTERETPFAIVMHPKKGWAKADLWALIPKGFRTSGVP